MQDKEQGKIIGNIVVRVPFLWSFVKLKTRIIIEIKNNKARVTLFGMTLTDGTQLHPRHYKKVEKEHIKLIQEYKTFVIRDPDPF